MQAVGSRLAEQRSAVRQSQPHDTAAAAVLVACRQLDAVDPDAGVRLGQVTGDPFQQLRGRGPPLPPGDRQESGHHRVRRPHVDPLVGGIPHEERARGRALHEQRTAHDQLPTGQVQHEIAAGTSAHRSAGGPAVDGRARLGQPVPEPRMEAPRLLGIDPVRQSGAGHLTERGHRSLVGGRAHEVEQPHGVTRPLRHRLPRHGLDVAERGTQVVDRPAALGQQLGHPLGPAAGDALHPASQPLVGDRVVTRRAQPTARQPLRRTRRAGEDRHHLAVRGASADGGCAHVRSGDSSLTGSPDRDASTSDMACRASRERTSSNRRS